MLLTAFSLFWVLLVFRLGIWVCSPWRVLLAKCLCFSYVLLLINLLLLQLACIEEFGFLCVILFFWNCVMGYYGFWIWSKRMGIGIPFCFVLFLFLGFFPIWIAILRHCKNVLI